MYTVNNPFAPDSNNVQSRYPDISTPSPDPSTAAQYVSWAQPGNMNAPPNGYLPQQQQQMYMAPQQTGYPQQQIPQMQPFQPSSSFGQQMLGSSYSYLQGQPTGLPPSSPQQTHPGYVNVAQFDPYASIGQWGDNFSQQGQQQQQQQPHPQQPLQSPGLAPQVSSSSSSTLNAGPSGHPHPREYIRAHKAELEAWDSYAWKQALGSFDALQNSWAGRRDELVARANQIQQMQHMYPPEQIQMEGGRLKGLHKEASSNSDAVAASHFQMKEVFEGYRQSGDPASKRRVREATNAALQSLPDWPSQSF